MNGEVLNTRGRDLLLAKPRHENLDVWSGGTGRSTTESELGYAPTEFQGISKTIISAFLSVDHLLIIPLPHVLHAYSTSSSFPFSDL